MKYLRELAEILKNKPNVTSRIEPLGIVVSVNGLEGKTESETIGFDELEMKIINPFPSLIEKLEWRMEQNTSPIASRDWEPGDPISLMVKRPRVSWEV